MTTFRPINGIVTCSISSFPIVIIIPIGSSIWIFGLNMRITGYTYRTITEIAEFCRIHIVLRIETTACTTHGISWNLRHIVVLVHDNRGTSRVVNSSILHNRCAWRKMEESIRKNVQIAGDLIQSRCYTTIANNLTGSFPSLRSRKIFTDNRFNM